MGRLIEQQAVIDCLTNTAKYYDMPQADEWTKGIHYGLIHGLDNILDNVPTVEAIPKADYENRLKADMVTMLKEMRAEMEYVEPHDMGETIILNACKQVVDTRINSLKENTDDT